MDLSKHLEKAEEAVKRKNYAFAVNLYGQFLGLQPPNGEARGGVRPGGTDGGSEVVGSAQRDAGAPRADRQTLTFDTGIGVKAGDRRGGHTEGPVEAAADGVSPGQVLHGNTPTAPTSGQTITISGVYGGTALRLSAGIEPDADGDGFGDVSQDACPAKASAPRPWPAL